MRLSATTSTIGRQFLLNTLLLSGLSLTTVVSAAEPQEIVITESRMPVDYLDLTGNTAVIDSEEIFITNPVHPYEMGVRVPGVWVSRGNGQEHLTAIRSAVLTGAGSCGAFLIMENSVPIRPSGFCNANQLMEVPVDQLAEIEVVRGPASALYGSNGLLGTMNALLPDPGSKPGITTSLEGGSNDFLRAKALWGSNASGTTTWNAGLSADRDDGYRVDSGYKQARGFWNTQSDTSSGVLKTLVSGSWLDQETAGYIIGDKDIYKDPTINRSNPFPEAYRKASSLRAQMSWLPSADGPWVWSNTGYLRWSDMDFLMHFLPGQPQEKNGQISAGYMLLGQRDSLWNSVLTTGIDLEFASGYLDQYQEGPATGFGAARRPQGQQYDYDVWSIVAAPYARLQVPLSDRLTGTVGLRFEYMRYDYTNNMISGNTRADGTPCNDPKGCLYFRPESQSNDFLNTAPELGLVFRATEQLSIFSNLRRGFRAPQATELYRLQAEQNIDQIKPETVDSFELGMHGQYPSISYELVGYAMRKDNYIFQDSNRNNVNDGKSKHLGIEAGFTWQITTPVYLSFAGTWAKHTYDFTNNVVSKGDRIDTAPDIIGSVQLGYQADLGRTELEWVYNDGYFVETTNSRSYGGHNLLNWRLIIEPRQHWWAALRVNNITDEVYADRADFAFGNYRYFPGRSREYYLEIGYRTAGSP
ncbi:MAG: TonB-dependent receptor [Gammaproteobacteria bacterium]|nr:TonB-dependent receptor [Gammaproteobacteria bacterium]